MPLQKIRKDSQSLQGFYQIKKKLKNENTDFDLPTYSRLTELLEETFCPKENEQTYHKLSCLSRNCKNCGVHKVTFSDDELSMDGECVSWSRYKYVELKGVENSDGTPRKRLSIMTEKTPPGELIEYFVQLLQYPFQQFMACWQHDQFDQIKEFLLQNHVLCVHDFSENYECTLQNEVQTQYFLQG